jgi:hypothetical protein
MSFFIADEALSLGVQFSFLLRVVDSMPSGLKPFSHLLPELQTVNRLSDISDPPIDGAADVIYVAFFCY